MEEYLAKDMDYHMEQHEKGGGVRESRVRLQSSMIQCWRLVEGEAKDKANHNS